MGPWSVAMSGWRKWLPPTYHNAKRWRAAETLPQAARAHRHIMRFLPPAALAAVVLTGPTKAQIQKTPYLVVGVGLASCGTWTAARRNRTAAPHTSNGFWDLSLASLLLPAEFLRFGKWRPTQFGPGQTTIVRIIPWSGSRPLGRNSSQCTLADDPVRQRQPNGCSAQP
jgi:hypothetical protein